MLTLAFALVIALTTALAGCGLQAPFPSWPTCNDQELACDDYKVFLQDWHAEVQPPEGAPYSSPKEWRIQDGAAADVDGDGKCELVLIAWRQSNFGSSTPFWKQNDTIEWTQHLFILRPGPTELEPVWMTSELGMEVQNMRTTGNRIELVDRNGNHTLWEWLSWGLTLVE